MHPGKLTWNPNSWRCLVQMSFPFANRWFVGEPVVTFFWEVFQLKVGKLVPFPARSWMLSSNPLNFLIRSNRPRPQNLSLLLLMEEIRLTSWYGKYPIMYMVLYIPGGAGFLPSTVSKIWGNNSWELIEAQGKGWEGCQASFWGEVGYLWWVTSQQMQKMILAEINS